MQLQLCVMGLMRLMIARAPKFILTFAIVNMLRLVRLVRLTYVCMRTTLQLSTVQYSLKSVEHIVWHLGSQSGAGQISRSSRGMLRRHSP